jgi:hypothetical protein
MSKAMLTSLFERIVGIIGEASWFSPEELRAFQLGL